MLFEGPYFAYFSSPPPKPPIPQDPPSLFEGIGGVGGGGLIIQNYLFIDCYPVAERFDTMRRCPGHYYVTVVEDVDQGKVIASATLACELKFIRGCAKVCVCVCSLSLSLSYWTGIN